MDGKPDSETWLAPAIGAWRELDGRKLERMMATLARAACSARAQSQPVPAAEFQPPPGFARTSMGEVRGR